MFSAAGIRADSPQRTLSLMALPLNLIALILSYLDDVGDLSRLCRTCRVLNYMALPQLYKTITLTSYDKIRYRDELPEGCGSASPFSMGLNAIVTRNVAPLVRSFTMRGDWREDGLDEHARVGRVPDSSMMLNIAVRAAIDRMTGLESFSWELTSKMMETAYIGLSQLPKLTSLTVRFPSSRHPRPTTVIPAMPHLRSLKVTDIDPLCYPDDISALLLHSKKLRELKMHWSPRMREAQEPSVTLHDYFRKCIAAKSPLRLRKIALQNFYALHTDDFEAAIDPVVLEEITTLNSPGVYDASMSAVTFVENSWPPPAKQCLGIKSLRNDRIERKGCDFLNSLENLERLYFVTPIRDASDSINSPRTATSNQSSAALTPSNLDALNSNHQAHHPLPPATLASHNSLRDSYIHTISSTQGARLRHLLLSSRWALPSQLIARLVRSCPNLEQLALATDLSSFETLGLLIPFLQKLLAIRLLIPTGPASAQFPPSRPKDGPATSLFPPTIHTNQQDSGPLHAKSLSEIVDMDDAIFNEAMGSRLADKEIFGKLKIIGLGWKAWELGEFYTIPVAEVSNTYDWAFSRNAAQNGNGVRLPRTAASSTTTTTPAGQQQAQAQAQPSPAAEPRNPPHSRPSQSRSHWKTPATATILGKRKQPPASSAEQSSTPAARASPPQPPLPHSAVNTPPPALPPPPPPPPNTAHVNGNSSLPPDAASLLGDLGCAMPADTRTKIAHGISEPTSSSSSSGEQPVLWRRRVHRVGWDVLQHWEIWGLDVQEI
ncbi:hypothetical protein LOZ49_006704 [Ophidiomyces ophidiicola]|nr:hypothetical protein LOZ49_006704 [Ophidiomyces ophidiicola]